MYMRKEALLHFLSVGGFILSIQSDLWERAPKTVQTNAIATSEREKGEKKGKKKREKKEGGYIYIRPRYMRYDSKPNAT